MMRKQIEKHKPLSALARLLLSALFFCLPLQAAAQWFLLPETLLGPLHPAGAEESYTSDWLGDVVIVDRESRGLGIVVDTSLFLYIHPNSRHDTGVWAWEPELGWLWTRADDFPLVYSFTLETFLFLHTFPDSGIFFYDAASREWQTYADLAEQSAPGIEVVRVHDIPQWDPRVLSYNEEGGYPEFIELPSAVVIVFNPDEVAEIERLNDVPEELRILKTVKDLESSLIGFPLAMTAMIKSGTVKAGVKFILTALAADLLFASVTPVMDGLSGRSGVTVVSNVHSFDIFENRFMETNRDYYPAVFLKSPGWRARNYNLRLRFEPLEVHHAVTYVPTVYNSLPEEELLRFESKRGFGYLIVPRRSINIRDWGSSAIGLTIGLRGGSNWTGARANSLHVGTFLGNLPDVDYAPSSLDGYRTLLTSDDDGGDYFELPLYYRHAPEQEWSHWSDFREASAYEYIELSPDRIVTKEFMDTNEPGDYWIVTYDFDSFGGGRFTESAYVDFEIEYTFFGTFTIEPY